MASKHVLADTFSDSVISTRGPRWTKVTRYWPTTLWNAGTAESPDSGWGLASSGRITECELTDAYLNIGQNYAALREITPNTSRRHFSFVDRLNQSEDQITESTFRFAQFSGDLNSNHTDNWFCGVLCRVTGESGTEFTSGAYHTEMLNAPTGYLFALMNRPLGPNGYLKFGLYKITGPGTAGGASTLELLQDNAVGAAQWVDQFGQQFAHEIIRNNIPFSLRYSCVTDGAVVEHKGYFKNGAADEEEVIDYDEGSGGLTEAGHPGFLCSGEIRLSVGEDPPQTSKFILGISSFEVQDGNGDTVMRDEWDRVQTTSARRSVDAFGRIGEEISGMFTGDMSGEDGAGELPQFSDRIVRSSLAEKLEFDQVSPATDGPGWHLFYQPPSNIYRQGIKATIDINGAVLPGPSRIAGVCARMSLSETAAFTGLSTANSSGYLIVCQYASGTFALRLHRYPPVSGQTNIATRVMNQSGDPYVFAVNTAFVLRLDIQNRDGASEANGNVHLDITVDGFRFTGWTLLDSGLIEEDDGSITDPTSARVLSGGATGFFAQSLNGTDDLFVQEVEQIDVALPVSEHEQGSIYTPGEADDAVNTLVVPHEWPVETEYMAYDVAHDLDSSHEHRHKRTSLQRRKWRIRSRAARKTEVDTLRDFFIQQDGAVKPFYWETPEGETVTANMEEQGLSIKKVDYKVYEFEVVLIEAIGAAQKMSLEDWGGSTEPLSGGGSEIVDDPNDTPSSPVFMFADDYGTVTVTALLSREAVGGEIIYINFGGDAVEGTHYTNDAAPGTTRAKLEPAIGDTEIEFTVTMLVTGDWHPERKLVMTVSELSNAGVDPVNSELWIWIRSTAAPPTIDFNAPSQSVSQGTDNVNVRVDKLSGTHEGLITVFYEVDPTSTAVEGTHWEWASGSGPYGVERMSDAQTAAVGQINILNGGAATLKFNLAHESSDRTEKNLWTLSHTLELEAKLGTKLYPGYPADNATGPFSIQPPDPVIAYLSSQDADRDPHGNPTTVLTVSHQARGVGYHRKAFSTQLFSAGVGGMIPMPNYTRYGIYMMTATGVEFPRFVALTVRDRGFDLNGIASGTGQHNYTVVYDTQAGTGVGALDSDGLQWDVYGTSSNWPTTDGEHGVEIETLRFSDGSTRDVARPWLIYPELEPLAIDNAMVRIWNPGYWGGVVDGEGETLEGNKGKGVLAFWPYLDTSTTPISGAPGKYYPLLGFFDGPLGNATRDASGTLQHTITIT